MNRYRFLICLMLTISLTSCVNHHPYPTTWSPIMTTVTGGCPSIQGTYKEIGYGEIKGSCLMSDSQPWGYCYSLSSFLLSTNLKVTGDTVVEITHSSQDEITIRVNEGTTTIFTKTLDRRKGDFNCNQNGIIIFLPRKTQAEGVGFATVGTEVTFNKANNGELVMSEKTDSFGMAMYIVPVAGQSTWWYHWEAAQPEGNGEGAP